MFLPYSKCSLLPVLFQNCFWVFLVTNVRRQDISQFKYVICFLLHNFTTEHPATEYKLSKQPIIRIDPTLYTRSYKIPNGQECLQTGFIYQLSVHRVTARISWESNCSKFTIFYAIVNCLTQYSRPYKYRGTK